jgi:glutamyl-tRNA synthetase
MMVEPEEILIDDGFAGTSRHDPQGEVGDFVVWTKRGAPAYQLAVVVDDSRQGVTDVVRGDDLLPSAARQRLLYRALGVESPRWWHLPLVLGSDGRRLAKRHGDTRIASYRRDGVSPERIIALIAEWCGLGRRADSMSSDLFRAMIDLKRLPRAPVTFTQEDHEWLLAST